MRLSQAPLQCNSAMMMNGKTLISLMAVLFALFLLLLTYTQSFTDRRSDCRDRHAWPLQYEVGNRQQPQVKQYGLNDASAENVFHNNLTVENSVIDRPCRRNTGILVQRMRDTQRQINRFFQQSTPNITARWELLPRVFGAAMNGFRYALKPFKFYSQDEFKHFLEFADPKAPCNHITLGVGGSWDGEKALRLKYPQCRMLGVDPVEGLSRDVVESDPNSRFILAAVSDTATNQEAWVKESNFKYAGNKKMKHRALTELLMNENEGRVIDFLTIDVEGAEFTLLKVLHKQRPELPVICQFNVEIHYQASKYGVTWEEVDQTLNEMFEEGHYVVLNVDERTFKYRRLFMFNIGDEECITKFLC